MELAAPLLPEDIESGFLLSNETTNDIGVYLPRLDQIFLSPHPVVRSWLNARLNHLKALEQHAVHMEQRLAQAKIAESATTRPAAGPAIGELTVERVGPGSIVLVDLSPWGFSDEVTCRVLDVDSVTGQLSVEALSSHIGKRDITYGQIIGGICRFG